MSAQMLIFCFALKHGTVVPTPTAYGSCSVIVIVHIPALGFVALSIDIIFCNYDLLVAVAGLIPTLGEETVRSRNRRISSSICMQSR
jgi:hypothetical protein